MQTISDLGTYTFPALFRNTLLKFSECSALSMVHGTPITYRELNARVERAARLLYKNGFAPKQKFAVFSSGMPNWGAAYLAIVNNGGIAVPLLPDFTAGEVEAILRHAEVDGMFVSDRLYARIESLAPELLPVVIKLDDFSVLRGGRAPAETAAAEHAAADNAQAADESAAPLPDVPVAETDTASIIYTSGTTGRSKGVELSHKNLVWTAIQCQTIHRVNKLDRCLSFLPLSHVYEFTIGFAMQILNGSCVYYLEKPPTVSTLLPAFKLVRPTVVLSVPLIMEKIYKNKIVPTFTSKKLVARLYSIPLFRILMNRAAGKQLKKTMGGKIKFFGIGGAKVDPEVERFMKEARFPYAIGYGLTETSPLLAGSGPKETVPGTIGPVMEGVVMRILDPDPRTGIGEVIACGPNVMRGYYRDEALTEQAFTTAADSCGSGWFKTGDLGLLEKRKGRLWLSLKGRSKNMILGASGENIYPEDIEFILNQHPLVSESLVVEDGNGLVALVQLDEEKMKAEEKKRAAQPSAGKPAAGKPGLLPLPEVLQTAVENAAAAVSNAVEELKGDLLYKREEILSEIQFFINNKVNRISKIGKVESVAQFEKTASQKIKRYLYNLKHGTHSPEGAPAPQNLRDSDARDAADKNGN